MKISPIVYNYFQNNNRKNNRKPDNFEKLNCDVVTFSGNVIKSGFSTQTLENLNKTANLYAETRQALKFFKPGALSELIDEYVFVKVSQNKNAREITFINQNTPVKEIGMKVYRRKSDKICEVNFIRNGEKDENTFFIKNFKHVLKNFNPKAKDYQPETHIYATPQEIEEFQLDKYITILRYTLERFNKFIMEKI